MDITEDSVTSLTDGDDSIEIADLDSELESISCSVDLDSFDVDTNIPENESTKDPKVTGGSVLENKLKQLDTLHEDKAPNSASFELAIENNSVGEEDTKKQKAPEKLTKDDSATASTSTIATNESGDSLITALSMLVDEVEIDDLRKWFNRVGDESFYRSDYRPVPREMREISQLARNYLSFGRNASKDPLYPYLMPTAEDPKSVLLKTEPVIVTGFGNEDKTTAPLNAILGHLILLNRCFFIGRDNSSHNKRGPLLSMLKIGKGKKYLCFHELSSIVQVGEFSRASEMQLCSFVIGVKDSCGSKQYKIYCYSEERLKAWLYAFITAVERSQSSERKKKLESETDKAKRIKDVTKDALAITQLEGKDMLAELHERGEKLNAMESQTNKLMAAAQNYGQLSKQLKQKLDKKNRSFLGI